MVAHNLAHPDDMSTSDHRFVPAAVFTHPQIASVGRTEEQAREQGIEFVTAVQPFGETAYGWATEDTTSVCKVLAEPATGRLIGAHIMGPHASTLIQPLIQTMTFGGDARQIARDQYWIHPALAEVVENALLSSTGRRYYPTLATCSCRASRDALPRVGGRVRVERLRALVVAEAVRNAGIADQFVRNAVGGEPLVDLAPFVRRNKEVIAADEAEHVRAIGRDRGAVRQRRRISERDAAVQRPPAVEVHGEVQRNLRRGEHRDMPDQAEPDHRGAAGVRVKRRGLESSGDVGEHLGPVEAVHQPTALGPTGVVVPEFGQPGVAPVEVGCDDGIAGARESVADAASVVGQPEHLRPCDHGAKRQVTARRRDIRIGPVAEPHPLGSDFVGHA